MLFNFATMIFITSFAPGHKSWLQQIKALKSWRALGVSVHSVNPEDEIPQLVAAFPEVIFHKATSNASEVYDKPGVFINDLICKACDVVDDIIFIINSDIELENDPEKLNQIVRFANTGLSLVSRWNYSNSFDDAEREKFGFDIMAFHKNRADMIPVYNFALGQPYWDYWLPFVFLKNKKPIVYFPDRFAYHKRHKVQYSKANWLFTASLFSVCFNYVSDSFGIQSKEVRAKIMRWSSTVKYEEVTC